MRVRCLNRRRGAEISSAGFFGNPPNVDIETGKCEQSK
ncbi:hypothetical protein I551_8325 [Mycobacterium ulcerans str. Harvey]|uniref:Uncharacterized protein n=1 Tax=Mycobacterium ulcerans str. Harvey TaxID=1299332 RepID=A0ABN0QKS7_MYCUL|nr:hypothetical protein I551_8325 [Mycobacterium ulcerans str. Harvey]